MEFKTDNRDLFDFGVEETEPAKWEIMEIFQQNPVTVKKFPWDQPSFCVALLRPRIGKVQIDPVHLAFCEIAQNMLLTYDLHHDEKMNRGNIMTEYEERFSSMGNPICKYVIRPFAKYAPPPFG